jgi:hypothetical protein
MNVKSENGKHNHDYPAMRSELLQVCFETQDMINGLRIAINTHAEIMSLHRYLLERFIPAPVLEAAVNEYAAKRKEQIEVDLAQEALASQQEAAPAQAQSN